LIPLLKSRVPSSPGQRVSTHRWDWTFFRSPLFWVYSISNMLQGFGYFFPSLYLPSYASSVGLGNKSGVLLLALMSIFQVGGQFVFGLLSDRKVPLDVLASVSTVMAAIACFAIWRLAESLPVLLVFAIIYGFFGAGFTATWARMSMSITDDDTAGPIVFSLLNFGKGVGNVLAGPIGGALMADAGAVGGKGRGDYRWVVVFTGTCMFASAGMIWLGQLKHLRLLKSG